MAWSAEIKLLILLGNGGGNAGRRWWLSIADCLMREQAIPMLLNV